MKLYNSLSQTKEDFIPLQDKTVSMYVCGITPYDTTHLGHAFTYLIFDVLQRFLTFKNYTVNYTQNVTDIDDDILKRAAQTNQNWQTLGKFWTDKFLTDLKTLHIAMPTHYVKATDNIPTIIEIIKKLEKEGFAYKKEGNVYFRTQKDPEYGKLARLAREQMILLSKERGADPDDPRKEDPLDFIMWQASKPNEPSWKSPWGAGRPGWHIECSAMAYKYLDKNIDIHGGGNDLIFPHHESEIAQSEQFTGSKPFAKYWMHVGMVMYQGEKMSKSLGNLVMVSDLLKKYSPNAIRYLLLSHHYRSAWEYHEEELIEAKKKMIIIETYLQSFKNSQAFKDNIPDTFISALADDLNTPKALDIMISHVKKNALNPTQDFQRTVHKMMTILGFII